MTLSSNIKKMTVKEKTQVGFLQGNGEPSLQAMPQLAQQLSIIYDVKPVTVNDTTNIPANLKTLVIVAPKDTIPPLFLVNLMPFLQAAEEFLQPLIGLKVIFQMLPEKVSLQDWLTG